MTINSRISKYSKKYFKGYHMIYGICEQYADDIATYSFSIFLLIWCMTYAILCTVKPTFLFLLWLLLIFELPRFLTCWGLICKFNRFQIPVLNSLLKLFSKFWDMDYFKVSSMPPYHSIFKKLRFNNGNSIKVYLLGV